MCKPKKPKPATVPDPVYVRNSYLDGSRSPLFSQRGGRNSLRNPLGGNGLSIQRGVGVSPEVGPGVPSGPSRQQIMGLINARF